MTSFTGETAVASAFDKGSKVKWKWGNGWGHGKIAEVFYNRISRSIKGTAVTRLATPDEPAYLIDDDDGGRVLKSHSELTLE
ncbi:hypervirulence associated TUDOR domain-containing protein [Planctomicrobium piriforme]|uniref:Hypervirulence associated protein TUDOR domain-containing protein n=1 Tax=Planctomicrobium piriforme TaxID=1576369 RepID=A0A1I3LCG5_9PLAN|nr:DUF2945 domain-containing protein [Planctomicrobium piriforme]SFI82492.1 Protein of unknown function [Planctomicrobium piriforme]